MTELSVTCEAVSDLAGLTSTHVSKIVNPARSRLLGPMSFSCVLKALGLRLVVLVDDDGHAPLRARLPRATFARLNETFDWNEIRQAAATGREMKVAIGALGGVQAVEQVPVLHAAVAAPVPAPKEPARSPRFDTVERRKPAA